MSAAVDVNKSSQTKHVLIVFAHPKHESFNGAILQTEVETLKSCGHDVLVSDLCDMAFDPVVKLEEFEGRGENVSAEVKAEMEKVEWADLILFQFPMYWMSPPAILKGWMDRVFQMFTHFVLENGGLYSTGYLKGKKAILCFTRGCTCNSPELEEAILLPIQSAMLMYTGVDVLRHQCFLGAEEATFSIGEKWLQQWQERLKTLFEEEPIQMESLEEWIDRKKKPTCYNKH